MQGALGRFVKGTHWRPHQSHWDAEWLTHQYVTLGRSTGEIAAECVCTDANILHWLRKHGIPRRNVSEARSLKYWGVSGERNPMHGRVGPDNPNYIDGSAPERQRLYAQGIGKDFIRDVLKRDGYQCRRCGAPKSEPKFLHVHHIKSWAGNEKLRFDPDNGLTLCRPCHRWVHSRANVGREFLDLLSGGAA